MRLAYFDVARGGTKHRVAALHIDHPWWRRPVHGSSRVQALSSSLLSLLLVVITALPTPALAQTGVSDDRVSLPDGPGSIDGLGDNASADGNMGQMQFSVPIAVEEGFPGLTPGVSLDYSSGGGASVLGLGWSMGMPFLERMTSRGLPEYTDGDEFVVSGSEELVRVSSPSAEPLVYRARFEGGFVRYSWHERETGDEGYWTAEYPDGRTSYFGADAAGAPAETARVRSPNGVFRYLLTETRDRFDHKLTYDYRYYGSVPLLDVINYLFDAGGDPQASVTFDYETRQDRIADARGGFNELLAHRMTGVKVFSAGEQIRSYSILYEDYATSGGASRIASVEQYGHQGTLHPVVHTFEYSKALGGQCAANECEGPYLTDLGNIGGNVLESGRGTLVDINGDSLPDLIVSNVDGPHQIFLSELSDDGTHQFATPFSSSIAASANFLLTDNTIQELDYDGDGFADLVDHITGQVLVNKGTGDWFGTATMTDGNGGTDTSADGDFADASSLSAADGELKNIKYFDYDGDRRIDILRSPAGSATQVLRNLGAAGYTVAAGVDDLGASFEEDNLELADMNGDGLLDPVKLQVAAIEYKLNLGRGKWTGVWTAVTNSPLTQAEDLPRTSLEDINGDGIDDIVVVDATEIRYAINRNGAAFDPVETITAAGGVAIPQRDASTTVLFADMNGNGSNDVVWVDGAGDVTYLELFPVRPNLLSRIENGIGMVTEVAYSSSVRHRARDGGIGWEHPLPMATLVVDTIDTWFLLGDEALEQHSTRNIELSGGFYDGVEKQFRGFEQVVIDQPGDVHQESVRIVDTYDVGAGTDRAHLAGRPLTKQFYSGDEPVQRREWVWDECALTGVPTEGLSRPIRWTCLQETSTVHQEQRPEAEWVRTRNEQSYDGYGNVVSSVKHGVVSIGGGACQSCAAERADDEFGVPCGAQCLGDEELRGMTYLPPESTDGWLLRLASHEERYGEADGRRAVTRFYYDGEAFVGLPLGQATRGVLTRVEDAVADGEFVQTARYRTDSHGNIVEEIAPRGSVSGEGFRTRLSYDPLGIDIVQEEQEITGPDGVYLLRRDFSFDPLFGGFASASDWYLEGEDPTLTTKRFGYDEYGRISWTVLPGGDTPQSPSEKYEYEFGAPFSRVVTRQRTEVGGPYDLEEVSCHDGAGRVLQKRARVDDDRWYVNGLSVKNSRGAEVFAYDGWIASTGECGIDAPGDVPVIETFYDGLGRVTRMVYDDDESEPSEISYSYEPLRTVAYDELDNADTAEASAGTILDMDGLGRLVRSRRTLDEAGAGHEVTILWDDLGEVRGFRDGEGNEKVQRRDLLGRIVELNDPDQGTWRFSYTADSLLEREERADGHVVLREYDDLGRKTAEWNEDDEDGSRSEFFYDKAEDCPDITCSFGAHRLVKTSFPLPGIGEGSDVFGYDERGQLVTSARRFGDIALMQAASYDNAGRQVEHVYPGQRKIGFSLDGLGRTTAIDGFISDIEFNERGLLSSYRYANGVQTDITFDRRKRVSRIAAKNGTASIVDLSFERNRVGNIVGVDDKAVPSGGASLSARYQIDAISRLLEAQLDPGGEDETITFEYDELERVVSRVSSLGEGSAGHVGDYGYDATSPRAATRAGRIDLDYDTAGQVTRRDDLELGRDFRGRLSEIKRGNTTVASFGYGAAGGRVLERFGSAQNLILHETFEVRDGVSRIRFGLDGNELVEVEAADLATRVLNDRNSDDAITAADAWLGRNDADFRTTLRGAARAALLGDDGEQISFLHNDHLGSTVAVSGDDGSVRERLSYFPHGQVRVSTAVETEYASYVGHDVDPGTGFINFGARDLSPTDGRWLTPDPAFLILEQHHLENVADAINVFSYALDNPVSNFDLGGLMTKGEKVVMGLEVTAASVGVAALVVGGIAMGAAIGAATCGIANLVGAIVGGVVSLVTETILQVRQAKKDAANGKAWTWKQKLKAVGLVALNTALGAVGGFATGGLSAIGTGVSFGASVAQMEGAISPLEATAIRVVTLGVFIGLGAGGASFGGADAALSGAAGSFSAATMEGVQTAETVVGVGFDTTTESASTLSDFIDHGGTVKEFVKADWKKSRIRKTVKGIKKRWAARKAAKAAKKAAKSSP